MKKTIFAGLALVALIQPAVAQEPTATYIHAGRLLADPASGRVETNKTIVVEGGKIAAIRDGFVGEGKIVDLDGPIFLADDRKPSIEYTDGDAWCGEAIWGRKVG